MSGQAPVQQSAHTTSGTKRMDSYVGSYGSMPIDVPLHMTISRWLRQQQTHYAAEPYGGSVDVPLRNDVLPPDHSLHRLWSIGRVQANVYDIVLRAGLVTKATAVLDRWLRDDSVFRADISVPCLSVTVHGDPKLFRQVATDIRLYLIDENEYTARSDAGLGNYTWGQYLMVVRF